VAKHPYGHWRPLTVVEAAHAMGAFDAPWWFTGGHALELHLGRSWREHDDIDVGICRSDAHRLRALSTIGELHIAAAGVLRPWSGEALIEGRHENNVWVRRHDGAWALDITIGEGDRSTWTYRRDQTLRLPWDRVVLSTDEGLPYLAPALQLLFKSTDVRPKDQLDADIVIPTLDDWSLALLDVRLTRGHPWLSMVAQRRRGMRGTDVHELVDRLRDAGVAVWVDGGWGIDALVGEQTRPHGDLDIALPTRHWARARAALVRTRP
jgi:Aminoglycoside-2''-adenylyltransferase